MENAKRPVFKGLRRLSYAESVEEYSAARKSPYYWWWAYLRLSKDYWWVCQQNGETLDAELKAMWRDFGDVFGNEFGGWWPQRGRKLFAEQVRLPHVRAIDPTMADLNPAADDHVVIEVPLNLTERTISRQVLAIVRAHPHRQIKPISKATRQLCKLRGIRLAVLREAHGIWRAVHVMTLAKQPNATIGKPFDRMTHQQLGVMLRLVRACMPKPTDSEDVERKKRNGMKVAVSRMVIRANALIANAEIGLFPSTALVAPRQRWTAEQQAALDTAVSEGKWRPSETSLHDMKRMLGLSLLPS